LEKNWDGKKKSGEADLDTLLRTVVLNQLGDNGDEAVIAEAKKRFDSFINKNESLSPDIKGLVFKLAVANGGQAEWDAMVNYYRKVDLHEEKLRALRSLGGSPDISLASKTIEFALSNEVRAQDLYLAFASVSRSSAGRQFSWKFLQEQFHRVEEKIKDNTNLLEYTVASVIEGFASEQRAKEIEEWYQKHPLGNLDRTVKQCVEKVRANSQWLVSNRAAVQSFLSSL